MLRSAGPEWTLDPRLSGVSIDTARLRAAFFGAVFALVAVIAGAAVYAGDGEPRVAQRPSAEKNERIETNRTARKRQATRSPQATTPAAPADLSLVVFDQGNPVPGLRLTVDGRPYGMTNADGALWTRIPSGRRKVALVRDARALVELDFLTDAGEALQMLVTLPETPDRQAEVDITSTATGEKVRVVRADEAPEDQGPPGALAGRIVSADSGEPVAGATIYFAGQATDATTDEAGRYRAELPAGNYRLSVVHPDYATQKLDNVRVIPGKLVTSNIELSPAGLALADYVVTAPYVEGSIASVFETQREAEGVIDIIGAEQMARTGDSDAAEALTRVTGLTIEGGRFAVIRGQPERYTYSLFNGSPLPSPDPIQRIVPLDLFPTGVLENVAVQKSYTADQPGEFGGGLIAINTRELSEEAFGRVSVKTGFNTESTFKDGFDYDGGGTDFLGFDDGMRELPDAAASDVQTLPSDQQTAIGMQFPNNYNVTQEKLPPDSGLSAVGGRGFDVLGGKIGLLGSFAWDREYRNHEQIERTYSAAGGDELILANDFIERQTDMRATLSTLLAVTGEWGNTTLGSNTFFIQNTTGRTEVTEGIDATSDDDVVRDFLLSWDEQQLLVQQLLGEHDFKWLKLGWRGLIGSGSRDAPDRREYRYTQLPEPDGRFIFVTSPFGAIREYNETEDSIYSLGADVTVPLFDNKRFRADAKVGGSLFDQTRESSTRRFTFNPSDEVGEGLFSPNPEDFLEPGQIGDTVEFSEQTLGIDDYSGDTRVQGVYLQGDMRLPGVARLVAGVRREEAEFSALSFQGTETADADVPGGFKGEDILPAVDFTYFLGREMQVRAAWSKTVSRPNLNELSPAVYIDPRTGDEFVGNPELRPAEITSYDLRWEWYPSSNEQLTAGVFRKDYTNPIELILQPLGESSVLNSVDNAPEAQVTGFEFSARAGLDKLRAWTGVGPGWLESMYVAANTAFIESEVLFDEIGVATSSARPLQGQAENIINLQLGYDGERHDFTVAYNRVGRRLFRPGTQTRPDIYREPVDALDMTYRYRPWEDITVGLELSNLLNPTLDISQNDQIYESFEAGVSGTLFLNWDFY